MKRIYLTLGIMAALTTGVYAQSDMEIMKLQPVDNQQYPNFANGDTLRMYVVIKNNGPQNLQPTDSIMTTMSLDWVIPFPGYILRSAIEAASLNSLTVGGMDTIVFRMIQGLSLGQTDDGPAIATIPSNTTVPSIPFRTYGYTYSPSIDVLNDPDLSLDTAGNVVVTGNNKMEVLNVQFGGTGIKTVKDNSSLKVYPNPVVNTANIYYDVKSSSNVTASVMDISGRIIMTKDFGTVNVGEQTFSIDVSSLNSGVYMLEINADNNRAISKFTVK